MKKGKKSFEFLINNLSDASLPVNSMPELDRLLSTFLNGSVIIFKISIIIWFIFHQIFKGFKLGLFCPTILGNNSNHSTMKLAPSSCIEICKSCNGILQILPWLQQSSNWNNSLPINWWVPEKLKQQLPHACVPAELIFMV